MLTLSDSAVSDTTNQTELEEAHRVIEILRSENEKLRSDLANVQKGLAGSVEFNLRSSELCQRNRRVAFVKPDSENLSRLILVRSSRGESISESRRYWSTKLPSSLRP